MYHTNTQDNERILTMLSCKWELVSASGAHCASPGHDPFTLLFLWYIKYLGASSGLIEILYKTVYGIELFFE